ncbi:amidase [Acidisphaera sp. L21]|uniref:amidase n=1 Tax=Acidisphaera sp. L21 TaxID=1641851 RepID=UPI001C20BC88|nr:amidase [Acidisphaera sp. L21]
MTQDLHFLTITQASVLIRTGKLSPVELTKAYLDRIHRLDGELHAYILVLGKTAMDEARRAEAEIAGGDWKGPLHGIPIGLKDIYNTAGIATTGHSALFKDHVPNEDAVTVQRLRKAGAVILGKLATHEFATGGPSFDLPWPPARNPWNLDHQPGGSSSGSAAAVAAGLCMAAMGTDTGGSIRSPAAWCGLAGFKPSYGRVSRRGILPLSFTLDHAGPLCWTTEDCALMMQALAGHDALDPGSADKAVPDFASGLRGDVKGLRVGVIRHFFETDLKAEDDVVAGLESALNTLRALGAAVTDVTLSPLSHYNKVTSLISRSEAYAIHERYLTTTPELYGELGRRRLAAGAFVRASDYVNALRHRTRLVAEMTAAMQDHDVLMLPTKHQVAPPFRLEPAVREPSFTQPFNVTGFPALSVCSGFSANGLPLSLQIVGRPFEDAQVLSTGDAFEKATMFRAARPAFAAALASAAQ